MQTKSPHLKELHVTLIQHFLRWVSKMVSPPHFHPATTPCCVHKSQDPIFVVINVDTEVLNTRWFISRYLELGNEVDKGKIDFLLKSLPLYTMILRKWLVIFYFFIDRVSWYSPGWLPTHGNPPASDSQVQEFSVLEVWWWCSGFFVCSLF